MQLYYTPGVCSLSPHIVMREAGVEFDLTKVDLVTKRTTRGDDYRDINTMGYVPALVLDGGDYLMGEQFPIADAYLLVMSTWASPTGVDPQRWPHLAAYSKRVAERPKVQEAMRAEGLIQ